MAIHQYGPLESWSDGAEKELSVEEAAAQVQLALGPRPTLAPHDVLNLVLAGFQRGCDDDVEHLFRYVLPSGALAARHSSSAGAMAQFRIQIRKEPRWKNIARRPQAALLRMRAWDVIGSLLTDADVVRFRVRASPFFPDASEAESEAVFSIDLVRQHASSHPDSAEMLGGLAGCWLINDIAPDYDGWHVKDPIGAGRAPDFFTPPQRPSASWGV